MESGQEPKRMLVFAGAAHNFGLLNLPEAHDAALSWLTQRLGIAPAGGATAPARTSAPEKAAASGNAAASEKQ